MSFRTMEQRKRGAVHVNVWRQDKPRREILVPGMNDTLIWIGRPNNFIGCPMIGIGRPNNFKGEP
jgi:hypothetical protein